MICLIPGKRPPVEELLEDPIFKDLGLKAFGPAVTKACSLRFPAKSVGLTRTTGRKQVRVVRTGVKFIIPNDVARLPPSSRRMTTPAFDLPFVE
jgi:hypothetical protein